MSFYSTGIAAPALIQPSIALPERAQDAIAATGMLRKGGPHYYRRGIIGVGAQTSGPVGSLVDGLLGIILDVGHLLLVLGGMFLLWRALVPG